MFLRAFHADSVPFRVHCPLVEANFLENLLDMLSWAWKTNYCHMLNRGYATTVVTALHHVQARLSLLSL